MSNFQFLESHWTDLAKLGDLSEKYVYSDPNTSIIKQGILSEVMVKYMLAYDGIAEPAYDNTHANRIRILKNNDLLPREIDNTLYILRKARNDAAHNAADEGEKALNNLQLMYELCVWYMQTYGDYNYEPTGYVQPVDMTVSLADLEKENAELEERNQQLLIEIEQIQKNGGADIKRRTVAYQKAINVHLSEAQTRELIDEQLRKVGWEADTREAVLLTQGVETIDDFYGYNKPFSYVERKGMVYCDYYIYDFTTYNSETDMIDNVNDHMSKMDVWDLDTLTCTSSNANIEMLHAIYNYVEEEYADATFNVEYYVNVSDIIRDENTGHVKEIIGEKVDRQTYEKSEASLWSGEQITTLSISDYDKIYADDNLLEALAQCYLKNRM